MEQSAEWAERDNWEEFLGRVVRCATAYWGLAETLESLGYDWKYPIETELGIRGFEYNHYPRINTGLGRDYWSPYCVGGVRRWELLDQLIRHYEELCNA